mgnify:CR=1 FL=1
MVHCPECGFVNAEGANYCQRCGAFLGDVGPSGDTTITYQLDDTGELKPVDLERVTAEGAALVIRSGGGRAGETFQLQGERSTIGRSPDAEVFLDDVTVSRNHALLVQRRDGLYIDDLGSLNGTYVNGEFDGPRAWYLNGTLIELNRLLASHVNGETVDPDRIVDHGTRALAHAIAGDQLGIHDGRVQRVPQVVRHHAQGSFAGERLPLRFSIQPCVVHGKRRPAS